MYLQKYHFSTLTRPIRRLFLLVEKEVGANINNIKYMWQKATVGYLSIVVLFKIIKLNFIIVEVTEFNIKNVTELSIA